MTKNLFKFAAGAAIAALALTGCGSADSESQPASGSTSSQERPVGASSDGPAQNVRVPQETELLTKQSEEGLKTFAHYWLANNSYAQQTGKTDELQELSAEDCDYCAAEIKMIDDVYEDGGWMAGGDPRASNIHPEPAKGSSSGTALIEYSEVAGTVFDSEGAESATTEAKDPTVLTVRASYLEGSWTMESIEETPDAELPEAE